MALPILEKITSIFHKKQKTEFFIVFLIESKYIKVAVWEKIDRRITILKIVKEDFSGSFEDLVEVSDRAISKASFGIPEEMIERIIFSVPTSWSDSGKIQANYLKILKNVCVTLSLKPLGFVVTTDAIVKNIDKLEPDKINFFLFHLTKEILNISFVEHGEVVETISSLRSENSLTDDFLEVLSRFKVKTFPSKIIIFDGSLDLEIAKQEILKAPLTQKEKRFLHFPSVEILPEDSDISSVVSVVGNEMGAGFAKERESTFVPADAKALAGEKTSAFAKASADKSAGEVESLGFFSEQDVAGDEREVEVIKEETLEDSIEKSEKANIRNIPLKKGIIILFCFFIAIILIFIGFWFFFSKADVVLRVKTSNFNDDVNVVLTESGSTKENHLKGQSIVLTVDSTKEISTTGTNKTGDKAKGEVTMFNKNTDSAKTFDKGTIITVATDGGTLKFLLDDSVTVASATQNTDSINFGKADVNVTAEKFGSEYNISDNKDWSVDGFAQSSYSAHNVREFSGGTTREIQVVSDADRENLLKKLSNELEIKAKNSLKSKIDEKSQDVLDSFVETKIIDKKFSGDVNDEAKKLSLDLKISFKTYLYNKDDAKKILDKILALKIPEGFFIDQNSISLKVNSFKSTTGGFELNFSYLARAIPKINISEIAEKIKGVYISSLDNYLKNDDILSYEVKIWPEFPGFLRTMPHQASKIKVQIKY